MEVMPSVEKFQISSPAASALASGKPLARAPTGILISTPPPAAMDNPLLAAGASPKQAPHPPVVGHGAISPLHLSRHHLPAGNHPQHEWTDVSMVQPLAPPLPPATRIDDATTAPHLTPTTYHNPLRRASAADTAPVSTPHPAVATVLTTSALPRAATASEAVGGDSCGLVDDDIAMESPRVAVSSRYADYGTLAPVPTSLREPVESWTARSEVAHPPTSFIISRDFDALVLALEELNFECGLLQQTAAELVTAAVLDSTGEGSSGVAARIGGAIIGDGELIVERSSPRAPAANRTAAAADSRTTTGWGTGNVVVTQGALANVAALPGQATTPTMMISTESGAKTVVSPSGGAGVLEGSDIFAHDLATNGASDIAPEARAIRHGAPGTPPMAVVAPPVVAVIATTPRRHVRDTHTLGGQAALLQRTAGNNNSTSRTDPPSSYLHLTPHRQFTPTAYTASTQHAHLQTPTPVFGAARTATKIVRVHVEQTY